MRYINIFVSALLFATVSWAEQVPQTPAQIQQQKTLADQMPVSGAPAGFLTPLKTFETYFSALARLDATEFQCMTTHAIKALFNGNVLNDQDLQKIKAGQQGRDERDYTLIEFRYTVDPDHPKIIFGYSFTYPEADGRRVKGFEREELTLVRTEVGWKIDLVE